MKIQLCSSKACLCLCRLENMVMNLCLPHFYTTVHCNKLCADGYDVTNLLSADPVLRRRGFKLEYFLRPPVQVTLKFGFEVELCRVDVELFPWGMDRGQACKRLEISTSSDPRPSQNFARGHKPVQQRDRKLVHVNDQNEQSAEKQQAHDSKSHQSNGQRWSLQAQQWGDVTAREPQKRGCVTKCESNTDSSNPEPEFKLVGRCELREETQICFTRSSFSPRPPFLSQPPPQPANCRQEELWSRGLLSVGAVTQLRVNIPCGGAASALGLKALAVWGQPARCCPAEEVERIKRVHEANERQLLQPVLFDSSVRKTKQPPQTATPPSSLSIPQEFLDPITQEIMTLPMLLPSGVSVDSTTLEEYQKREATWGRAPNDPFTGVPFTSTSQPLPNPQLKSRIDHFVLQKGVVRRDGMLGRQGKGENPQASRLIASKVEANADIKYGKINSFRTTQMQETESGNSSDNGNNTSSCQPVTTEDELKGDKRRKQDLSGVSNHSAEESTAEKQPLPQAKRPRNDAVASCSSHEQRLSASLDEALFTALQGRPSFTSRLSQHRGLTPDYGPANKTLGEKTCSACSCSVSVYSTSASSIYRLTCGHLLCHACLQREPQPRNSVTTSTTNQILCPACHSPTARTDVIRVHY
ncbi:RING finger protein 37 isoform X3 [Anabas testudineus]|uniref:RING finger protein 37 isoform X3 n=2 Tax=Anabas testudineus TaxID=64144 RepID=UPI000E453F22|nr:RING finger protein 37 isoform X3 [Anabas testudineus]